jgi:hypothetical protein
MDHGAEIFVLRAMSAIQSDLLALIDKAIAAAAEVNQPAQAERCGRLVTGLRSIRSQVLAGTLEASQGGSTLGLAREVADWIDSLDSPLLKAVGEIERLYQNDYRP